MMTTTPGARRPGLVWSEVPVPGESSVIDCESDSGGNVHTPTDDNPLNTHAADSAEVAPASKDDWIKCTQCSYTGPPSSFPLRLNGTGHVRTCAKHTRPRRQDAPNPNPTTLEKISWESLLDEIRTQAAGKIEIDRFVFLDSSHPGAHGETLLIRANIIMDGVKHAAGYRFNYKRRQDSTQKTEKSSVFTYYCAQLEGEQTKHALHPDESKRRPKKIPKIPRFHCNGWSSITVSERMPLIIRVRIMHNFAHLAVFSKRASGIGIGANNTLSPQLTPVSSPVDSSTPIARESTKVSASAVQPESSVSIKKTLKRKRNDPKTPNPIRPVPATDGNELCVVSEGDLMDGPAASISANSSVLMSRATHPTVGRVPSESVPGGEVDNFRSVKSPVSLEGAHITLGDTDPRPSPPNQDSWPASIDSATHSHRPQIPSHHQSQHLPIPLLPPPPGVSDMHMRAHVLFPSEYISELRRKANVAFAAAERPGGMSIDEARAFEAAFAPLAQLVHELESRDCSVEDVEARVNSR